MSDIRFTLLGIAFIFAGFLVLGVFGQHHYDLFIQSQEFGECFDYTDGKQIQVSCTEAMQDRVVFLASVITLLGIGVFFLIKGVRGKWDQDVKPQDKIGPDTSFPS